MTNVIDLEARRAVRNPHRHGQARCLNCKLEWMAVAPIGAASLQCPGCETYQGLFKGINATQCDQWRCLCGELHFFIDVHGPYCCHCGQRPEYQPGLPPAS